MHRWKFECNNINSILNYTSIINLNQIDFIYFSNQHKQRT